MFQLDQQLFEILNNLAGYQLVDSLLRLTVNEYFIPVFLALILFYLWISPTQKYKKSVVTAALAVATVNVVVALLNLYFDNPRPFELLNVNLAYYQPTDPSFPSNGAAVSFAIATAIWLYHKKLGWLSLVAAGWFSLGRVTAGIHFPSDAVAGASLGVIFSLLFYQLNFIVDSVMKILLACQRLVGLVSLTR